MNKNNRIFVIILSIVIIGTGLITATSISRDGYSQGTEKKILRLGYFPNINHAQAVIGIGNGDFQKELGDNIEIKSFVFNAGPSAIEALFARQIDAAYVGPNPAINGYIVSGGKNVKIIAGASSGGAVFVVRNDSGIQTPNGYKTKEKGGNVEVIPIKNPDILTLMLKKEIDGAWVPEPWGEKLIKEGNARLFLDERTLWPNGKFVTANIIVNPEYLRANPDVIKKFLEAHINETQWINNNKVQALNVYNTELKKLTGQTIPEDQLKDAFSKLELTYDPLKQSLFKSANDAFEVGFLGKTKPDLTGIYDLTVLNDIIKEKNLTPIDESVTSNTNNSNTSNATSSNISNISAVTK